MTQIRVLVADDHRLMRTGIKLLIDSEPDMTVVGEAGNGHEAIAYSRDLRPDVLILDIAMPGLSGMVAAATLRRSNAEVKILIVTRHSDKGYIQELLQAGISGYVLKQSDSEELLRAVRVIAAGGEYIDPAVTGNFFGLITPERNANPTGYRGDVLSERESHVLRQIARGYSNKEIADELETSVKTIETQRATGMRKLNIHGRSEIVRFAILQGWLGID